MDLLGDIGNADQLTSARGENKILQKKVDELKSRVRELSIENESLKAEVNIYRKEALSLSTGMNSLNMNGNEMDESMESACEEFVKSGNGIFPSQVSATLQNLHGVSNPLCCVLHTNDGLMATGGADGSLVLTQWGMATAPTPSAASDTVQAALRFRCDAPVLKVAFPQQKGSGALDRLPVVAAGCMDGNVKLMQYDLLSKTVSALNVNVVGGASVMKHGKYVKDMAWSPNAPILATACAEGNLFLTKVNFPDEMGSVDVERLQTLHLPGDGIEALCFLNGGDTLCCFSRGTSYISYFDLKDNCKQTRQSVNGAGSLDDFVSFTILSLVLSPNGKFIAAATDTSRNIIFEAGTPKIIRDLYGHKNDGFSTPKIAWSGSGSYLFGNTQDDNGICVWDIASASIVKKLDGEHSGIIRDIFSSSSSDTLVTASYDKTVRVWSNPY